MSVTQTAPSTPQHLVGRTAVVTGGSCDISTAVAHRLTTDGTRMAMVYRSNAAGADVMVNHIRSTGAQTIVVQADVGDAVSVDIMVNTVRKAFDTTDILVNNAGILKNQPVDSIDLASSDAQLRTNAFSTILVTQAVLPHVPACGGHIVNVSSGLIYRPRAGLAVYVANKAVVGTLTHAFAVELGPRNITVNAVAPALTHTDMTAPIPGEVKTHMRESTPVSHLAELDDIADTIAFLVSNDARWITGRTLMTDGGFV